MRGMLLQMMLQARRPAPVDCDLPDGAIRLGPGQSTAVGHKACVGALAGTSWPVPAEQGRVTGFAPCVRMQESCGLRCLQMHTAHQAPPAWPLWEPALWVRTHLAHLLCRQSLLLVRSCTCQPPPALCGSLHCGRRRTWLTFFAGTHCSWSAAAPMGDGPQSAGSLPAPCHALPACPASPGHATACTQLLTRPAPS